MEVKGLNIDLSNFLKTVDLDFLNAIYSYVPDSAIKKLSWTVYDMYMRYLDEIKLLQENLLQKI